MEQPPSPFAQKLLENFKFAGERESLQSVHELITGELMEKLLSSCADEEEARRKYHQQCIRSLDWSFNDNIVRDSSWLPLFAGAIEEMEHHIKDVLALGVVDAETMRDRIPLDSIPFKYAKRRDKDIHVLPKDDEVRVAFQALFLFLLRPYIPLKYEKLKDFLANYPHLMERNGMEQERLRFTANWMDLAFHSIQPRNNKTFILNIIPRIVEGRNARYITGSGQTKPTADRVDLFRLEGQCEKIKRPPRKKKELLPQEAMLDPNNVQNISQLLQTSGLTLMPVGEGSNDSSAASKVPMLIPFYPGFSGYSVSSVPPVQVKSEAGDSQQSLSSSSSASSAAADTAQSAPTFPFPGGIPFVVLPQMPAGDDGLQKVLMTIPPHLWSSLNYNGVPLPTPSLAVATAAQGNTNNTNPPLLPSSSPLVLASQPAAGSAVTGTTSSAAPPMLLYHPSLFSSNSPNDPLLAPYSAVDPVPSTAPLNAAVVANSLSSAALPPRPAPPKRSTSSSSTEDETKPKRRKPAAKKSVSALPNPLLESAFSGLLPNVPLECSGGGLELLLAAAGDLENDAQFLAPAAC